MAAVRPAGPEPTMTTLAWLLPSASGEAPLPPGCWLTRRSLVASAGAPSSTIEMLGKPSLVLSIPLNSSRTAYPPGVSPLHLRRGPTSRSASAAEYTVQFRRYVDSADRCARSKAAIVLRSGGG